MYVHMHERIPFCKSCKASLGMDIPAQVPSEFLGHPAAISWASAGIMHERSPERQMPAVSSGANGERIIPDGFPELAICTAATKALTTFAC